MGQKLRLEYPTMGNTRVEFQLNEAEGGAPAASAYDFGMSVIRTFPNNQVLPYTNSGATKGSLIFPGIYGPVAQGLGSVQPTPIPDYYYYGEYPLAKQPTLNKPYPWEIG